MKVLMLSTDRKLFEADSAVGKRVALYAALMDELHIIVFSCAPHRPPIRLGKNVFIYSTNSFSRFAYVYDAVRIGAALKGIDVVTTQDPFEVGLAGMLIARRLGAPLHVQVHTHFLGAGFAQAHWPLNGIRMVIARFVLSRAKRIRTVSERIKEKLIATYALTVPISVLPIFVDAGKFHMLGHTTHPRFKTTLLVVSRLEKEKHVDTAIDALKKARDAGFPAGIVVVGTGNEESALKKKVKDLGLSNEVEFPGFQADLLPYYSMADLVLSPGAPYEGFGMVVIEALAAGVPVLSRDVGVAREAGAMIAEGNFGDALLAWLSGAREKGVLRYSPYASTDEYARRFVEDIALCKP